MLYTCSDTSTSRKMKRRGNICYFYNVVSDAYIIDLMQDRYEEVDIATKGGNYGWRVYEGPLLYNLSNYSEANNSSNPINAIFPVMGYKHSSLNKAEG